MNSLSGVYNFFYKMLSVQPSSLQPIASIEDDSQEAQNPFPRIDLNLSDQSLCGTCRSPFSSSTFPFKGLGISNCSVKCHFLFMEEMMARMENFFNTPPETFKTVNLTDQSKCGACFKPINQASPYATSQAWKVSICSKQCFIKFRIEMTQITSDLGLGFLYITWNDLQIIDPISEKEWILHKKQQKASENFLSLKPLS